VESRILGCLATAWCLGAEVTKPEKRNDSPSQVPFWLRYRDSLLAPIQPIGSRHQGGLKWAPFLNIALSSSPSQSLVTTSTPSLKLLYSIPTPSHLTYSTIHPKSKSTPPNPSILQIKHPPKQDLQIQESSKSSILQIKTRQHRGTLQVREPY
jgi:hypothetical protein